MTVCVYGLWHLGTVTAACLASRGIATVGLAETPEASAAGLGTIRSSFLIAAESKRWVGRQRCRLGTA